MAFSDHWGHVVTFTLTTLFSRHLFPRNRPLFKMKPALIKDEIFTMRLTEALKELEIIKVSGLDIIQWWSLIVKPGI